MRLAELLKINAVMKGDPLHIKYDNGEWQKGVSAKFALSGSVVGSLFEGGANYNVFEPYGGEEVVVEEEYGFFGIAMEAYFVFGGEIKIGVNVEEFVAGLEEHYDQARFEKYYEHWRTQR